jgi:putative Ca2+/H+ antiporter (TMEM165/GDT1 family)
VQVASEYDGEKEVKAKKESKKKIGKKAVKVGDEEEEDEAALVAYDTIENDKYVHFFSAFVASFSVIIVSEIGDKTFFIAAVMAMKYNRIEVFSSAIAALALMTVLSAAAGHILPNLLSPVLTHYASMVLFFYFGVKLLKQGWETDPNPGKNEELEEVEEELERSGQEEGTPAGGLTDGTAPAGTPRPAPSFTVQVRQFLRRFLSPVFIQGFTMTFLAEWGDRSQIATIALAAARDPFAVTLGGILGHAICTGGAVLSGKFAAARISERAVAYFGGVCFLLCGLYSLYAGPDQFEV